MRTAQADLEEELIGPAASVADKNPKAAEAFAKKAGVGLQQLQRITTPGTSGTGTLTPRPHNQADLAAATTWSTGTFQTTPVTSGIVLWGQSIPLTAGANWAEWVTPGAEWRIGPSSSSGAAAYVALFVTASVTGSNIDLTAEVVFSE